MIPTGMFAGVVPKTSPLSPRLLRDLRALRSYPGTQTHRIPWKRNHPPFIELCRRRRAVMTVRNPWISIIIPSQYIPYSSTPRVPFVQPRCRLPRHKSSSHPVRPRSAAHKGIVSRSSKSTRMTRTTRSIPRPLNLPDCPNTSSQLNSRSAPSQALQIHFVSMV